MRGHLTWFQTQVDPFHFPSGGHLVKGQVAIVLHREQAPATRAEGKSMNGEGRWETAGFTPPVPEQEVCRPTRYLHVVAHGEKLTAGTESHHIPTAANGKNSRRRQQG